MEGQWVLLAEDHPDAQGMAQAILESGGVSPRIVDNGQAATEAAIETALDAEEVACSSELAHEKSS